MAKVTIDGKEYETESMPEEALANLGSLQYVDKQIQELSMRAAAYQTARNGYANALKSLLENGDKGNDDGAADITIPDDLAFD